MDRADRRHAALWPREDFELAGTMIPKGASVAIVLASANRDEGRFEEARIASTSTVRASSMPRSAIGRISARGTFLSRADRQDVARGGLRVACATCGSTPAREVVTKGWRFRGVMNLPALWDA